MDVSNYIDLTFLSPLATDLDVKKLCKLAIKNKYYAVCIDSSKVNIAKSFLKHSDVKIATIIGLPHGTMSTELKIFEAKKAIHDGADEIEVVINLGLLKNKNYPAVLKDLSHVKLELNGTPLKAIIEIPEISKNDIIKACEICLNAKVDFIKTSSGLSNSRTSLISAKIIKKSVKKAAKVQVSGNINDIETAAKYLVAGMHRINIDAII